MKKCQNSKIFEPVMAQQLSAHDSVIVLIWNGLQVVQIHLLEVLFTMFEYLLQLQKRFQRQAECSV